MPRFHFNVRGPQGAVFDPDGADFPNADDAYDAAVRTARTLMAAATESDVDWKQCVFEIADENGETVFELPFTEAADQGRKTPTH